MIIKYTKGKNSLMGNPRIVVEEFNDNDGMQKLIENKHFRRNKNGLVSVANAGFVYAIGSDTRMILDGVAIRFIRIYK